MIDDWELVPKTAMERAYVQARYLKPMESWRKGMSQLTAQHIPNAAVFFLAVARAQALNGEIIQPSETLDWLDNHKASLSQEDLHSLVRILCDCFREVDEQELHDKHILQDRLVKSVRAIVGSIKNKSLLADSLCTVRKYMGIELLKRSENKDVLEKFQAQIRKYQSAVGLSTRSSISGEIIDPSSLDLETVIQEAPENFDLLRSLADLTYFCLEQRQDQFACKLIKIFCQYATTLSQASGRNRHKEHEYQCIIEKSAQRLGDKVLSLQFHDQAAQCFMLSIMCRIKAPRIGESIHREVAAVATAAILQNDYKAYQTFFVQMIHLSNCFEQDEKRSNQLKTSLKMMIDLLNVLQDDSTMIDRDYFVALVFVLQQNCNFPENPNQSLLLEKILQLIPNRVKPEFIPELLNELWNLRLSSWLDLSEDYIKQLCVFTEKYLDHNSADQKYKLLDMLLGSRSKHNPVDQKQPILHNFLAAKRKLMIPILKMLIGIREKSNKGDSASMIPLLVLLANKQKSLGLDEDCGRTCDGILTLGNLAVADSSAISCEIMPLADALLRTAENYISLDSVDSYNVASEQAVLLISKLSDTDKSSLSFKSVIFKHLANILNDTKTRPHQYFAQILHTTSDEDFLAIGTKIQRECGATLMLALTAEKIETREKELGENHASLIPLLCKQAELLESQLLPAQNCLKKLIDVSKSNELATVVDHYIDYLNYLLRRRNYSQVVLEAEDWFENCVVELDQEQTIELFSVVQALIDKRNYSGASKVLSAALKSTNLFELDLQMQRIFDAVFQNQIMSGEAEGAAMLLKRASEASRKSTESNDFIDLIARRFVASARDAIKFQWLDDAVEKLERDEKPSAELTLLNKLVHDITDKQAE